jgi:hypothetical protein
MDMSVGPRKPAEKQPYTVLVTMFFLVLVFQCIDENN